MLVYPTGIPTGGTGYTIENAIWFDGSADELTFTPSQDGTGAGKKYTLSFWTKIIDPDSTGTFFSAGQSGGDSLHIQTDWTSGNPFLNFTDSSTSGSNWLRRVGTRVLRDSTAWIHICFAVDNSSGGGLAGTANAARVYINGVEDTSFASANSHPASSDTSRMTMQYEHVIGNGAGFNDFKSFYLAEFVIVDGQQLTPTSFGEYDDNGVWIPINVSGLTFGNNGCYLNFKVAPGTGNGAGTDVSGNNNHFTDTSMTTAQQVTDSPTDDADNNIGNFCIWNPLQWEGNSTNSPVPVFSEGNLRIKNTSAVGACSFVGTHKMHSGKFYWEVTCNATSTGVTDGYPYIGVIRDDEPPNFPNTYVAIANTYGPQQGYAVDNTGSKWVSGTETTSFISSYSAGVIIMIALDLDNGKIWFGRNGSWPNSGNPATGANEAYSSIPAGYGWFPHSTEYNNSDTTANFGQKSFTYTVPTGFNAGISTHMLPAPTVTDPSAFYQSHTYTGNGTAIGSGGLTETFGGNSDLQPDFVWIKCRSDSSSHMLFDSVREATNFLQTNSNGAEDTVAETLTAFNPDGFTLGNNNSVNVSSRTYVAWCWKAGGAPTADNSASAGATPTANSFKIDGANRSDAHPGTIKTIRGTANTTSGFAILKYNGGDSDTTLGTGLTIPTGTNALAIIKKTSANNDWHVCHEVDGTIGAAELNNLTGSTTAEVDNFHSDSGTTITIDATSGLVNDDADYICYLWKEIAGYSKFGTYTGNGATAPNGTYVHVGFRPKWLMIHRTDGADEWVIFDSVRNPHNECEKYLSASYADEERTNTAAKVDLFSNGFRPTVNHVRVNSGTYFYAAFAEHPFGGDGVAQARAR